MKLLFDVDTEWIRRDCSCSCLLCLLCSIDVVIALWLWCLCCLDWMVTLPLEGKFEASNNLCITHSRCVLKLLVKVPRLLLKDI